MDRLNSRPSHRTITACTLLWLSVFTSPARAADSLFSFVDYNIAFVLGLSLPVILFAALLANKISIKWGFVAAITGSILGLFYAAGYLHQYQTTSVLSASALFLSLSYLWPFYNDAESETITWPLQVQLIVKATLVTATIAFILIIWALPGIDAYLVWLVFSAVVLLLALLRIISTLKNTRYDSGRLVLQWIIAGLFAGQIYLWLNTEISTNMLAVSCVLIYLITLINGNWFLVQHIYHELLVSKVSVRVNSDDLFSYTHDPATHLPNYQQAIKNFERTLKHNPGNRYAAIVLKPTNFQEVNSVLGHHNSDILLLQLAYCLQQSLTDNDSLLNLDRDNATIRLARMQGLNFLVVLDLTDSHHPDNTVIEELCRQMTEAVPNAMSFKSFSLHFKLAFGIAISGQHGDSVAELIAHAGDALLDALKNTKTISYFSANNTIYTEQKLAEMEQLKQDIQNEQLQWQVQPQVNINSKKLRGFELKVQWQYGEQPLLNNQELMQLAELSGDVHLLTKLLITQAFRLLKIIQKQNLSLPVTINLSGQNLLEPDLGEFIERQMTQFGIAGKYLVISLDEAIVVQASEQAKQTIDQLKAMGLNIAIAEFSGSYEALKYIRKMAVNEIKINCSQLINNVDSATDKAIVSALINLTRAMGLPLIGTDVGSQNIEQMFANMGGEYIQGKLVCAGIKPQDVGVWLLAWFQQYPHVKPDATANDE